MTCHDAHRPARGRTESAGLQNNEVIAHESRTTHAANGRRPLVMEFTVQAATGPAAHLLAKEQATAIRQVLAWIASKQPAEPGPDGTRS